MSSSTESEPSSHLARTVDRHTFVDALRGLALLGILVVNIEYIVQPLEIGWLGYDSTIDRVFRWLVIAFGQTKVYPLFALLFGYGLSIQMINAERRGVALGPRYRRRMLGLVLLGVIHGILFFPGDILVIYAVVGAVAYRFRSAPIPTLLRLAAVTYGLAAVTWLGLGTIEAVLGASDPTASADAVVVFASGSLIEVVRQQFGYWLVTLGLLSLVQGPAVLACFLAGIALGRTDLLSHPDRHRALAGRVLVLAPIGVVGGGLGATLALAGGRWSTLGFAVGFAVAPLLTATYVVMLAAALHRGWKVVGAVLQPSGRMSLSVYLLESIVVSTLSYGYGFGLFGRVGPAAGVVVALVIWGGLSAFSALWMRVFRFGPFEWGLRSFTYGGLQPLRHRSGFVGRSEQAGE